MSIRTATLAPVGASQQLLAVVLAAGMGLALLFLTGFAEPTLIHNAAHDWRHAHNFPCH